MCSRRITALLAAFVLLFSSVSVVFAQSGAPDKPAMAPVVYRINSDGSLTKETAPSYASYAPAPPPPPGQAPIVKLDPQASVSNNGITPLSLSEGYYYYNAWYYVGDAYTKQTIYFYQDKYGNQTVYWTEWDRNSGSSFSVQFLWLYNRQTGGLVWYGSVGQPVNPTLTSTIQWFVPSGGYGSKLSTQFAQGLNSYWADLYFGN
jgi:hypothetical protein